MVIAVERSDDGASWVDMLATRQSQWSKAHPDVLNLISRHKEHEWRCPQLSQRRFQVRPTYLQEPSTYSDCMAH